MAKKKKFRIVHYLNNFFSGFGGEEAANMEPKAIEGPIKVGKMVFQPALGETAEIVATIVRGDNGWTTKFIEKTTEQVISLIKKYNPDLVIAGPAFNAGRYGIGCGAIGKAVKEELGIPFVAGMYHENPAIDLYKQYSYIVRTSDNALTTKDDAEEMAALAVKLLSGQEVLPDQDNYIPRFRRNYFTGKTGAERAYEILDNKLAGKPPKTEYPMPEFDRVAPSEPIHDLSKVTVALVTSGGIVPKGNPDRIESSSAQKFGQYSIGGIDRLTAEAFQTAHGGYDPTYANADPHRVLPLDILRDMEKSGIIGKIHDLYYSTVGNGTSVGNSKRFGEEIGKLLVAAGVQAVIMTSTWGTCTRCGATMAKEIERQGILVVHCCSIVPISITVGGNRIIPTTAIPHPFGDPTETKIKDVIKEKETELNKKLSESEKTELEKKLKAEEPERELRVRREYVEATLKAMQTHIDQQTVFSE